MKVIVSFLFNYFRPDEKSGLVLFRGNAVEKISGVTIAKYICIQPEVVDKTIGFKEIVGVHIGNATFSVYPHIDGDYRKIPVIVVGSDVFHILGLVEAALKILQNLFVAVPGQILPGEGDDLHATHRHTVAAAQDVAA